MKEGLNKWKALPSSWVRKLHIVKMFIPLEAIDRFNVILIKIPVAFFFQKWKRLPSNLYGVAKDLFKQNHFEGGKKLGGPHIPDLKTDYKDNQCCSTNIRLENNGIEMK